MTNEQPDPTMQEQFEQLRRAISKDVADQMTLQLGAAKNELKANLKEQLDSALDSALTSAKNDLKQFVQVRCEELKDHVKMAADGYGGTLESIDRRLKELSTKWDTRIADHDLVLRNHTRRLEKLEQL